MDRPLVIFRQLGVPVYAYHARDGGITFENNAKPESHTSTFCAFCGQTEEDWPVLCWGLHALALRIESGKNTG